MTDHPLRVLRRSTLSERTGLARSSIYDRLDPKSPRYDPTFPRPIPLGPGSRARGWLESEVERWIEDQIARRHAPPLERPSRGRRAK